MRISMMIGVACAGMLLAACSATQVADATKVSADAAAVVADLTTAEQQVQATGTFAPATLTEINTAIALVNSDIAALDASGASAATVTAILTDINSAIQTFGPLAPEITALIGVVGGPVPAATTAHAVRQGTVNSLQADLTLLHKDAGK